MCFGVFDKKGNQVGFARVITDYETTCFVMNVVIDKRYRGLGIGTSLLKQLLSVERLAGYSKISLSVQKSNYAVKMYKKAGFTVIDENSEEYIMLKRL